MHVKNSIAAIWLQMTAGGEVADAERRSLDRRGPRNWARMVPGFLRIFDHWRYTWRTNLRRGSCTARREAYVAAAFLRDLSAGRQPAVTAMRPSRYRLFEYKPQHHSPAEDHLSGLQNVARDRWVTLVRQLVSPVPANPCSRTPLVTSPIIC